MADVSLVTPDLEYTRTVKLSLNENRATVWAEDTDPLWEGESLATMLSDYEFQETAIILQLIGAFFVTDVRTSTP